MASNQDNTNPDANANANNGYADKASGAAKFVTGAFGNTIGGISRTAGNVTGAATKGVGDTFNNVTGENGKPIGNAFSSLGSGIQNGLGSFAKGAENAGQWKTGSEEEKK